VRRFELLEPATLDEAVSFLDPEDPGVRAIGGNTALMLMMKARLFQPTRLVSLRRLNGSLRTIHRDAQGLRIGSMVTLSELEQSRDVEAVAPVMTQTLHTLSNVRVRNVATVGGHLAHGDPHMDLPPVLLTLAARIRAVGRLGERWIDMSEFAVGYYETALAKDELIADLHVPAQPAGVYTWYSKFSALSADDWPTVGVAVWFRRDADRITEARIAVSAATERPVRLAAAERAVTNKPASATTFADAADAAAAEVEPLADIRGSVAYKREMVRVHVRRALTQALESGAK
jgi:carbon-monoxide dehydrogenase medium subunit